MHKNTVAFIINRQGLDYTIKSCFATAIYEW